MNDVTRAVGPHRLSLEDRTQLALTGVEDVARFDEEEIVMTTLAGVLVVKGAGLHIDRLSLDGGELHITGQVDSLAYEAGRSSGGFLSRLLGG